MSAPDSALLITLVANLIVKRHRQGNTCELWPCFTDHRPTNHAPMTFTNHLQHCLSLKQINGWQLWRGFLEHQLCGTYGNAHRWCHLTFYKASQPPRATSPLTLHNSQNRVSKTERKGMNILKRICRQTFFQRKRILISRKYFKMYYRSHDVNISCLVSRWYNHDTSAWTVSE